MLVRRLNIVVGEIRGLEVVAGRLKALVGRVPEPEVVAGWLEGVVGRVEAVVGWLEVLGGICGSVWSHVPSKVTRALQGHISGSRLTFSCPLVLDIDGVHLGFEESFAMALVPEFGSNETIPISRAGFRCPSEEEMIGFTRFYHHVVPFLQPRNNF